MFYMNETGSWIKIKYFIPFRNQYLYWDKSSYEGDIEFQKEQIKVRWVRGEFKHPEKPYIGLIITCWTKDATKVEKALTQLDKKLRILDKNYAGFIKEWHQGLLNLEKKYFG